MLESSSSRVDDFGVLESGSVMRWIGSWMKRSVLIIWGIEFVEFVGLRWFGESYWGVEIGVVGIRS